jgi:pyridinium-3,5-biscarboxylic acid mononucleotide sulfurtransferase
MKWFENFRSCIVAFSAGVDSSLLAAVSKKVLGDRSVAVTSISPAFSVSEREEARKIAKEIGIQFVEVGQNDLEDENYVKNGVMRCYFCRSNLASAIEPLARRLSIEVCVDGTHVDDLKTPRPGIKALREAGFRAPLAELHFGKNDVRQMARLFGLSNWERPSEACLSSRIAYGQKISLDTLNKIELAERIVKSVTNARIVRVRTIGRNAIIEVDKESVHTALEKKKLISKSLQEIGYDDVDVDIEGYVSGRMLQLFVKNSE